MMIRLEYKCAFWLLVNIAFANETAIAQSEHESVLHGTWHSRLFAESGRLIPEPIRKPMEASIIENTLTMTIDGVPYECSFKLGTVLSPRHIDLIWKDVGTDVSVLGIYDVIDGDLWLCYASSGGSRPSSFGSLGNGTRLHIFSKSAEKEIIINQLGQSLKSISPPKQSPSVESSVDAVDYENSIGMKFRKMKPGIFKMSEGKISRTVAILEPFYLSEAETTVHEFQLYAAAMKTADPSWGTNAEIGGQTFEGGRRGAYRIQASGVSEWEPDRNWHNTVFPQDNSHPVVFLSWNDAVGFAKWLSEKEKRTYRLPTEAEWEYACRAGSRSDYFWGNDTDQGGAFGNFGDTSFRKKFPTLKTGWNHSDAFPFTAPVRSFAPNRFGLFDMLGNAWEWVGDKVDSSGVGVGNIVPRGDDDGEYRIARGGGYATPAGDCRSGSRFIDLPDNRFSGTGFRLVLETD
jgi:uncharacterized protein (TIGR03067 family)